MNVLVTGAGGFIGRMVVADLAGVDAIPADGDEADLSRIFAADIEAEPVEDLAASHDRVIAISGDLAAEATQQAILQAAPDVIVHLAAVVSSAAEADFDVGLRVNVLALLDLIDVCRRLDRPPVFVFTSSVAVFGCEGNETIDDTRQPTPLSSYGTQKVMGELLVRDASRKGFMRGRSIRFPTISVRPGKPNKAASSFASGIIREPLAGKPSELPVDHELRLHLASPEKAVEAVRHAIALRQGALEGETTITLPGITVTVGEMIEALRRIAGDDAAALIEERPDPDIAAIVRTWPGKVETPRARALGFEPDQSFDDLVHAHIARMQR